MIELFEDGFGVRTLEIEQESGDAIEVLSFAPALIAAPDFASAVGERVARLSRVRHTLYARARRLDRPSENTLLLSSDRSAGWRLADMLAVAERDSLPIDISAVLALLRQLIPAVALFARHQRDAAIGTIGPERLIVTPQGRLLLAEYVLAPGIEQLRYSRERLWRELRVTLPALVSPTRITPSADVVGIGVVALSMLLGRKLVADEFLDSLDGLFASLTETSAGTTRPLSAGFSAWLGRALHFDENTGFQSTQEAQIAFEQMLAKERSYVTSPAQLDLFIARFERIAGAPAMPPVPQPKPVVAVPATTTPEPEHASEADPEPPIVEPEAVSVAQTEADAAPEPVAAYVPSYLETPSVTAPVETTGRRVFSGAFAAVAAAAVLEAAIIAWLLSSGSASAIGASQLVVRSQPSGARVIVDDQDRGATPLTTSVSPGTHTIGIVVGTEERFLPIEISAGVQTEIYIELPRVTAPKTPSGKK